MSEYIKSLGVHMRLPDNKLVELKMENLEIKIVWDDNLFSEVSIEKLIKENGELKHMRDGVILENETLRHNLEVLTKSIEEKNKIIDFQTSKIKKLEVENSHWKLLAESFKGLYELECSK